MFKLSWGGEGESKAFLLGVPHCYEASPAGVSLHFRESCSMLLSLNFPSLQGGEQVSSGCVASWGNSDQMDP